MGSLIKTFVCLFVDDYREGRGGRRQKGRLCAYVPSKAASATAFPTAFVRALLPQEN